MKATPLPQGFGAEIDGIDLRADCGADTKNALRAAYLEHQLLVFRGCGQLNPERQVDVAGWFGPVGANGDGQGRDWTVLHNGEAAGSLALPFHCDISFMKYPLEGISLHPLELPQGATSTTFVSNAVAWQSLPGELQHGLQDLQARHHYAASETMSFDWPLLEYWHPVRLVHPHSGQPLLFVTEHHVDRIAGMTDTAAQDLLAVLFGHLYAPERRYEHLWQKGDLVIWDNLAIQHARTRPSQQAEGVRALQRVAIGKHNFLEQLQRAKHLRTLESRPALA